jgi:hypothetical protein
MIASQKAELLRKLRRGDFSEEDFASIESAPADRFVEDLKSSRYRLTFQERRVGSKWEVSLAHSFRAELKTRQLPDADFVSFLMIPAYLDCVMLNIEDNRITGISRIARLSVWQVNKPERGLALRSGRGFKFDRTIDGWQLKPMKPRIVKLSGKFLQGRGWRFDHLKKYLSNP